MRMLPSLGKERTFPHRRGSTRRCRLMTKESEGTLMMWGYDFGWGGMSLIALLWIALLVVLVWALIRWINGRTTTPVPPSTSVPPTGPSAMEILRQRYARGEITSEQYRAMRAELGAPPESAPQGRTPTGVA
jgi:putative membrane protein